MELKESPEKFIIINLWKRSLIILDGIESY